MSLPVHPPRLCKPRSLMPSKLEQRTNMRFCFKLGKTVHETQEMLSTVYGANAMTLKTIHKWFRRFREGHMSVEDDGRSGRPATAVNNEKIAQVFTFIGSQSHRRVSVREIAKETGISFGSVQSILKTEKLEKMVSVSKRPYKQSSQTQIQTKKE